MADVFLSYSRRDWKWADRVEQGLTDRGFDVFRDHSMVPGSNLDRILEEARTASCVVVLWSAHSVGSEWVRDEAQVGLERGVLVPGVVDGVSVPADFGEIVGPHLIQDDGTADPDAWVEALAYGVREHCEPMSRRNWADRLDRVGRIAEDPNLDAYAVLRRILPLVDQALKAGDQQAAEGLLSEAARTLVRRNLPELAPRVELADRESMAWHRELNPAAVAALERHLPGADRRQAVKDALGAAWPSWAAATAERVGPGFHLAGVSFCPEHLTDIPEAVRIGAWHDLWARLQDGDSAALEEFGYELTEHERDEVENLLAWHAYRSGREVPVPSEPRTPEQHARLGFLALNSGDPVEATRAYTAAANASAEREDDTTLQALFLESARLAFGNVRDPFAFRKNSPDEREALRPGIDALEGIRQRLFREDRRAYRFVEREIEGLAESTRSQIVTAWGRSPTALRATVYGHPPDPTVLRWLELHWAHPGWSAEVGSLAGLRSWAHGRGPEAMEVWSRYGGKHSTTLLMRGLESGTPGLDPTRIRQAILTPGRWSREWLSRLSMLRGAWPAVSAEHLNTWTGWLEGCDAAIGEHGSGSQLARAARDRLAASSVASGHQLWLRWLRTRPLSRQTLRYLLDEPYLALRGDLPLDPDLTTAFRDALSTFEHEGQLAIGAPLLRTLGRVRSDLPPDVVSDCARWADTQAKLFELRLLWADEAGVNGIAEEVTAALTKARGPSREASRAAVLLGRRLDLDAARAGLDNLVERADGNDSWDDHAADVALLALALRAQSDDGEEVSAALDCAVTRSVRAFWVFTLPDLPISDEDKDRAATAIRRRWLSGRGTFPGQAAGRVAATQAILMLGNAGRWRTTDRGIDRLVHGLVDIDSQVAKLSGWSLAGQLEQSGDPTPFHDRLDGVLGAACEDGRVYSRAGLAALVRTLRSDPRTPSGLLADAEQGYETLATDRRVLVQASLQGSDRPW